MPVPRRLPALRMHHDPSGPLEEVLTDGVSTAVYDDDDNGNRLSVTTPAGVTSGTPNDLSGAA